jgi:hypothetical protein
MDRFYLLTTRVIDVSILQCIGVTCLHIASKIVSRRNTIITLADIEMNATFGAITIAQMKAMEVDILTTLSGDVDLPTPVDFL